MHSSEFGESGPSALEINNATIYMVALRDQRLWKIPLDRLGTSTDYLVEELGRLRDVTTAPDGSLWILPNHRRRRNRASRTTCSFESKQTEDAWLNATARSG